jgi:hypothetical protein
MINKEAEMAAKSRGELGYIIKQAIGNFTTFLPFGGAVQWEVLELRNILLRYHVFVILPRRVLLFGAAGGNFVVVGNRNIITT